jgi:hypothetical protein
MENPDLFFPELSPIENNILERNYSVDDGEAILIISLDIGDGRKDEIRVYEHDNSDQLALDFCYKHKLGARAKILLADEIEKYFKIALSRAVALVISQEGCKSQTAKTTGSRGGRNQTFTQRSMQVKQNMIKLTQPKSPEKPSISMYEPLSKRLSPTKLSSNQSPVHNSPAPRKRPNKRFQSMYERNDDSFNNFIVSKSVWAVDSSISSVSTSFYTKPDIKPVDKSERIMKKVKYSRYKEIFNSLNPNPKGVISPETIQRNSLSPNLLKIIHPLIEELESLNETLDFHEFYDAMEILMKVLTPGEKSTLLLPNKTTQNLEVPKPFVKNVSMSTRNMSTSSLYERGLQKKQEFSRKIEKEKEIIHEAEMKECKFIPKITSVHRRSLSSKSVKGFQK